MTTIKKSIDFESFLRWVYADESTHVRYGQGVGLLEQERSCAGLPVRRQTLDGSAAVANIQKLGVRVDGGGFVSDCLPHDADLCHTELMGLAGRDKAASWYACMVVEHAVQDRRPDYYPDGPSFGPKLYPDHHPHAGKRMMIRDHKNKIIGCAVQPLLTIDVIEAAHTAYLAWWDMVQALFLRVRDKLQVYEIKRFNAHRTPWAVDALPDALNQHLTQNWYP